MQKYRRLNYRFSVIFVLSLMLAPVVEGQSSTITILYTGNLNAAVDDCGCGGDVVGGLTRISSVVQKYQQQYPDLLLLDSGDFLNSYSDPPLNRLVLQLLHRMNYTAINLGDQEFVEGLAFLNHYFTTHPDAPLVISGNIRPEQKMRFLKDKIVVKTANGVRVHLWGFTSGQAFDFIAPNHLKLTSIDKVLADLPESLKESPDLKVLLFHGKWSAAEALARNFPFLDAILIAHNQQTKTETVGSTLLAEPGMEGEYLGLMTAKRLGRGWRLQNEFIPIRKNIREDIAFQKQVNLFYQSGRKQKITSKIQSKNP